MSSYLLTTLATGTPEPEDVTAGWIGAVVLIGLVLAVVFLGFSLVKQLRKAQAAEDAGVYGHLDEPADADSGADAENGEPHPSA